MTVFIDSASTSPVVLDVGENTAEAARQAVAALTKRNPNAIAIFGDSRMAEAHSDQGVNLGKTTWCFLTLANALMGQRLIISGQYAQAGQPSSVYMDTDSIADAIASDAGWVVIFGVVNDIAALSYTPFEDNIKPACEQFLNAGMRVILCTEPGSANTSWTASNLAAKDAAVQAYNRQITDYARDRGGVVLFDLAAQTVDPTSTGPMAFLPDHSGDDLHFHTPGAYAQALAFKALMEPLVPARDELIASGLENSANGVQGLPNPLFLISTGGTAGGGVTGDVPSGWTAECQAGLSATTSVTPTDYGNEFVANITASNAGQFLFYATLDAIEVPGDEFDAMAEIEIDAGHSNLATAWIRLLAQGASDTVTAFDLYSDTSHGVLPAGNHVFTVRTPKIVVPSGARANFNVNFRPQFIGAGSATVRIRRASSPKLGAS